MLRRSSARPRKWIGTACCERRRSGRTLMPDGNVSDIDVLNLTARRNCVARSRYAVLVRELLLNLRAGADPELLRRSVVEKLEACGRGSPVKRRSVRCLRKTRRRTGCYSYFDTPNPSTCTSS